MYHMVVEQAIVAREMVEENEALYQKVKNDFPTLEMVSHEKFKNKHAMRKQLFEQMRQHHMPILF